VGEAVISVLVPSRTKEFLHDLFRSMENSEPGSVSCVIVGDNGLPDDFKMFWSYLGVSFVPVPMPFIFSRAVNRMASVAPSANDLLVLNDDTEILSGRWLTRVDLFMQALTRKEEYKLYGLVSLQIEGRAGNPEQTRVSGDFLRETESSICFVATLIRRHVWDELGPMDERYIGYGHDDDDYCVRVWHAGYLTGVTHAAMVKHDKGPGVGTYAQVLIGQDWEDQFDLNAKLFSEKWGITFPGRKGLSRADEHLRCFVRPWHRMP
jgi:hypothetical protein